MQLQQNDKVTNTMVGHMDHSEAVNQMAAEKYLLGELPPDVRDAFEEHFFDCPECAFDIRTGMAFLDEAKVQLPALASATPQVSPAVSAPIRQTPAEASPGKDRLKNQQEGQLRSWWRGLFATPVFAAPVFATLLVLIGYQNLVTYPALRSEATEPRVVRAVSLHGGTRAGGNTVIEADRKQGVSLLIDLPEAQGYSSFVVDLYDAQGKLARTHNVSIDPTGTESGTLSLVIPGGGLQQGVYMYVVSGVTAQGQRSELERHGIDIHVHD
jgi:Putative zinc-finger